MTLFNKNRVRGILSSDFYERDTITVARELLGKLLMVRSRVSERLGSPMAQMTVARIVETEGYHGDDPASHSSRGKTPRCAPMFEAPGKAYVYFIYGMYQMLNFVTERENYPGAVLIRAVEPIQGQALMRRRRNGLKEKEWTCGPGRLTQAMGIKKTHNRTPLSGPSLFVVDDGYRAEKIMVSPRVGISVGSELPWRFFLAGSRYVSRVKENKVAHEG